MKQTLPTIIFGDFNENPEKLRGIMKLVEEEGWVDIGLHADWWGGPPAANTCEARKGVKASRIDGAIANPEAAVFIQEVWVKKNPFIPTHAAIGIRITRNAMKKEKTHARTLPTLKKAMEDKIREELARKAKGEKAQTISKQSILQPQTGEETAAPERACSNNTDSSEVITKEELDAVSDRDFAEARKTNKAELHEKMDKDFV